MIELKVEIGSHFFRVIAISARFRPAVLDFAKRFVQMGMIRVPRHHQPALFRRGALRVFGAATDDREEFRFHVNALADFQAFLKLQGFSDSAVEYRTRPMYEPLKVEYEVQERWKDYDYQVPPIEYLTKPEPVHKLIELQTGKGKSYICMRGMQNLGFRALMILRPMYIEKWIEDLGRTYQLQPSDMIVVQGSSHLQKLLILAREGGLQSKIILVSNKTVQNWLKLYEEFKEGITDLGYECMPDEFAELLQAGIRVIDEVHQDFHLNFKLDLYTHVPHSFSLSATLIADQPFLNQMYELAYPKADRYQGGAYHKYIAARALIYHTREPHKLRSQAYGSPTYSHVEFEKSIMRQPKVYQNYLELITQTLKMGHFRSDWKPGNRCLVYCGTIELCTKVRDHLQTIFPDQKVMRYVEEDPYETLREADIIVSTLLSAGTAVDIVQLTTVILTVAVTSSPSNLQGFGRLRELKDGTTPEFWYYVCEDVPKHLEYHNRKQELLQDRALNYKSYRSPVVL